MDLKKDRMRYQANQVSYNLGLFSFLFYCIYLASTMDNIPKNILLGLEIFINLGVLMVLFLGIEKARNYNVGWSWTIIALGSVSILRVFWQPFVLLRENIPEKALWSGVSILLSGIFLVISGIIGARKGRILEKYNRTHPDPAALTE